MTDEDWAKLVDQAAVAMAEPVSYSQGKRVGAPDWAASQVARTLDALHIRELVEAAESAADAADWNSARYDEWAAQFHHETGFMAPGKDIAALAEPETEETYTARRVAWIEWVGAKQKAVLARLRAALDKVKGGERG